MKKFLLYLGVFGMFYSVSAQPTTPNTLPPPFATKSVSNFSKVVGWKDGKVPQAPPGFKVTKYADGFDNPRWMSPLTATY